MEEFNEIQEWFKHASEDIDAAELLFKEKLFAQSLFHCQQAIEKALKGALIALDWELIKTHDLFFLFEEGKKYLKDIPKFDENYTTILSDTYIYSRYPHFETVDCDNTLVSQIVKETKDFVINKGIPSFRK